jgi:hypothetical protein
MCQGKKYWMDGDTSTESIRTSSSSTLTQQEVDEARMEPCWALLQAMYL